MQNDEAPSKITDFTLDDVHTVRVRATSTARIVTTALATLLSTLGLATTVILSLVTAAGSIWLEVFSGVWMVVAGAALGLFSSLLSFGRAKTAEKLATTKELRRLLEEIETRNAARYEKTPASGTQPQLLPDSGSQTNRSEGE